jgi:hypothetical protein
VELPVHDPTRPAVRSVADARRMAVVVQANVVQLKIAEAKHRGRGSNLHDIRVKAPGTIRHFREALIDHRVIVSYSAQEVHLRLREVWGQFCTFCWLFSRSNTTRDANLADLPPEAEMHCEASLQAKEAEVHALLWRTLFEQRLRHDRDYRDSKRFAIDDEFARQIPATVFNKPVSIASDEELLLGACEYVGMLATVRWLADRRLVWAAPELMAVRDEPF